MAQPEAQVYSTENGSGVIFPARVAVGVIDAQVKKLVKRNNRVYKRVHRTVTITDTRKNPSPRELLGEAISLAMTCGCATKVISPPK